MRKLLQGRSRRLPSLGAIVLVLLCVSSELNGQVAGYSVGTRNLDIRAIPCNQNRSDLLCQPSGDVYLGSAPV
jgi:hypothetical protein